VGVRWILRIVVVTSVGGREDLGVMESAVLLLLLLLLLLVTNPVVWVRRQGMNLGDVTGSCGWYSYLGSFSFGEAR
jgi:hypothetical protein